MKLAHNMVHRVFLRAMACMGAGMVVSSASAQTAAADDYKTYTYKTADGQPQKLDFFSPSGQSAGEGPVPVIILFHGGGWTGGDKDFLRAECRYFAHRGIAAVSANYRFLNKNANDVTGTKTICLQDAKSAIRWIKSHSVKLGIDPKRVILGGGSAGGHLATMAQLETATNDPQDDLSISTTGVALVLFNPGYETTAHTILGMKPSDPKIEPYPYISAQVPPMIMFFGDQDPFKKNADLFLKPCKDLGVRAEMWIAPGENHAFFNKPEWTQATCVQADRFLTSLGLLQEAKSPPTVTATLVPSR